MKKLLTALFAKLALVGAMLLISEVILAAVFYFAGVVTPQKAGDVVKVLQGALASPPEDPVVAEAPVVTPLEIASQQKLQEAVAAWEKSRAQQQQAIDSDREAIQSMTRELETVRAELDAREKAVAARIEAFDADKAAAEAAAAAEGFKTAVSTYSLMEAKDVAKILYSLSDADAVRYLKAFKNDVRAEVLTEILKLDAQNPPAAGSSLGRAAALLEMIGGGSAETAPDAAPAAM